MSELDPQRICAVIAAYNEGGRIGGVVRRVRAVLPDVVVVDDGSADATAKEAEAAGALVLKHAVNSGKGAAMATAFDFARAQGFEAAITLDGDGQHDPADMARFLAVYREGEFRVLVGNRMADTRHMPLVRLLTNRFMSWLLSREMGQRVPDTQCGFRLYSLDVLAGALPQDRRFAAESEILMELSVRGVRIGSVPVATVYGTEQSKIHPGKDTVRFFGMLRRFRKARKDRRGAALPRGLV